MGNEGTHLSASRSLHLFLNNVRPCDKCEFRDHIKQMKAEPFLTAFLATEMCKLNSEIVVHRAQGDNQDKSGNFVRNTLKLAYETCAAHEGPIMEKKRHNMSKFRVHPVHGTVEDMWKKLHKFVKRVMDANTEGRRANFCNKTW